jgi:fructan beta-fructosidase
MIKLPFQYTLIVLTLVFLLCACNTGYETGEEVSRYSEQHRPRFHFSPDSMWTNDPNGMVFYEGEYHLFYQHNPFDNVWGPMHWGHAVSTDLVHWNHLPIALYPDSLGTIFSGSAVIDWENSSGLGRADTPPMIAIFTHHNQKMADTGSLSFQYQSIAYSLDKGRSWTKYPGNPVLENPGIRDFRDPKVIWHKQTGRWIMVFAARDKILFYSSLNLIDWRVESEFTAPRAPEEGVWECPDFFPLQGEEGSLWVLLVSVGSGGPNGGSGTKYYLGEFDGSRFAQLNEQAEPGWIDYGKDNYAGVTWSDIPEEDGRRLFLGWMSNWQYANKVPTEKWRNAMTVPRELSLAKEGLTYKLVSRPVDELDTLLTEFIRFDRITFSGKKTLGLSELEPSQYDIEFTYRVARGPDCDLISDFGIVLENLQGQELIAGYNLKKNQVFVDRTRSGNTNFSANFPGKHTASYPFADNGIIKFRALIDHSSIELFVDDGKLVMTELFFPDEPFHILSFYSNGGSIELTQGRISSVKSSW